MVTNHRSHGNTERRTDGTLPLQTAPSSPTSLQYLVKLQLIFNKVPKRVGVGWGVGAVATPDKVVDKQVSDSLLKGLAFL